MSLAYVTEVWILQIAPASVLELTSMEQIYMYASCSIGLHGS